MHTTTHVNDQSNMILRHGDFIDHNSFINEKQVQLKKYEMHPLCLMINTGLSHRRGLIMSLLKQGRLASLPFCQWQMGPLTPALEPLK